MKNSAILILSVIITLTTGCQKEPYASFDMDLGPFLVGDLVGCYSTSINAYEHEWILPDGSKSNSPDVWYTFTSSDVGLKSFTLNVYSKNGKKMSSYTQNVNVYKDEGSAVFYRTTGSGTTTVHMNGQTKYITANTSSTTDCGATGAATFENIPTGDYSYTASNGSYNWNGTVSIMVNGCSKIHLTY